MFPLPPIPPIPPIPPKWPIPKDPTTIFNILKFLKDLIFGNGETEKKEIAEKKSTDLEKAEITDIAELNAILSNLSNSMKPRVDAMEQELLNECLSYFDEFFGQLEALNEMNQNTLIIKMSRYQQRMQRIRNELTGSFAKSISKRISLDDEECRRILKLLPGDSKKKRTDEFVERVILDAVDEGLSTFRDRMAELGEELIETIEDKMEDMMILEQDKMTYLQELENSKSDDEKKMEQLMMQSMLTIDQMSYLLRIMDKEA